MAKKKAEQDVREDPRYHDTRKLLRKYRDVTWSLELSVQRLKNQFQVEYGTDIEEFLDSVYVAGADLGGTELEHHARCIERSHKMLAPGTRTGKSTTGCCISPTCLPNSSATQRKSSNSFIRTSGISASAPTTGDKRRLSRL